MEPDKSDQEQTSEQVAHPNKGVQIKLYWCNVCGSFIYLNIVYEKDKVEVFTSRSQSQHRALGSSCEYCDPVFKLSARLRAMQNFDRLLKFDVDFIEAWGKTNVEDAPPKREQEKSQDHNFRIEVVQPVGGEGIIVDGFIPTDKPVDTAKLLATLRSATNDFLRQEA